MRGAPFLCVGAPDNRGRTERAVLRFFFFSTTMSEWLIACLCILLGFVCGAYYQKVSGKKKIIGTLFIDKKNPEVNGGVYTVWDGIDPVKDLTDGDVVEMDVSVIDFHKLSQSQQNQGA